MNPYRGLTSTSVTAAANHVTRTLAADAVTYDGGIWMNPASPAVRAHVTAVVQDIIEGYDVDGIHFDDYFYPYPDGVGSFPDSAAFTAYTQGGGTLTRSAWRRENVNSLIEDTSVAIAATRPSVRFGVSPFGIYRPGTPAGITGLDAFEAIACDPVTWLAMDWVDYLAPQLYWPTTQTRQAFGTLLPWWASLPDGDGRFVLAGMNLAAWDPGGDWTLAEYEAQTDIVRAHLGEGAGGSILYHLDPLLTDDDVKATFSALNVTRALPPPVAADLTVPTVPTATIDGDTTVVTVDDANRTKGLSVYVERDGAFVLENIVFGDRVVIPAGERRAVAAIGNNDRESRAVVVGP